VLRVEGGNYTVQQAVLTQEDGLRFQAEADPLTAELLAICDGSLTLREATARLRAVVDHEDAMDDRVDEAILQAALRMLRLGFLVLSP